jgi:hypothetical protein
MLAKGKLWCENTEVTQVRCLEEILELLFANKNFKQDGDAA